MFLPNESEKDVSAKILYTRIC